MLVVAYATGRASHAIQVKGDDPDKKEYPGPPVWSLGVRLTTSSRKKKIIMKPQEEPWSSHGCRADDDVDDNDDDDVALKIGKP